MFKGSLQLDHRIKADKAVVMECLTDMQKFQAVHPVIQKIVKTDMHQYQILEELRFAGIKFRFNYPALLTANTDKGLIAMTARVMGVTKVEIRFSVSGDETHCQIEETISFNSLLPTVFIMKSIFRKQHTLLFKNIEEQK